jgi:linoleoyl-CoA desaturase
MSNNTIRFPGSGEFFAELKHRVAAYLEQEGVSGRDAPAMYLKTAIIMSWLLGSYLGLLLWAHNALQIILLSISLGLAMTGVGFSIQHDGNHGGYSKHNWINQLMALSLDLIGGSSYVWHWKHNVIHHTYSNIAHVDSDLDVGFFARLSPDHRRLSIHRFQHFYVWALYALLPFKWIFVDDYQNLLTGKIGTQKFPRPSPQMLAVTLAMKAVNLFLAILLPLWFHPVGLVVLGFCVASVTLGIILAVVFQMAHCHERAEFPLPDANHRMSAEWATHQVATTVDFARENALLTWWLGGLNFQVEHHLFPKVCHVHYRAISKIVEATCREYGLLFRSHDTLGEALSAHARWLRRMGEEPTPPDRSAEELVSA